MDGESSRAKKHFILVHGACHGAWSWYKVKPRLEGAGHKVTAIDLSAAGINTEKKLEEIQTLHDYSSPLLEVIANNNLPSGDDDDERVILVGHSFGGFSLAFASDKYPHKISVAVYVAAFMPDSQHPPSYVINKMLEDYPDEEFEDKKWITTYGSTDNNKPVVAVLFSDKYLSSRLYQLCDAEDVALAKMLVRPITAQSIQEDMSDAENIMSREGYGSVKRVYIVCEQDKCMKESFQRWEIENAGVSEVMEIEDADHMPMFSKPQQLCQHLLEIAHKY